MSHRPDLMNIEDVTDGAPEPPDGWPCVECGLPGEACVCEPCGVLGCTNDLPCPIHDSEAHARELRRLDEKDRGGPRDAR